MIKQLTNVGVWVHDQDEALAFYTESLGLEVRQDVTVPEMGNFRWLSVGVPGQDDISIVLLAVPGPPVFDEETASQMKSARRQGGRERRTVLRRGRHQGDLRGAEGPRRRVLAGADASSPTGSTPASGTSRGTRCGWRSWR